MVGITVYDPISGGLVLHAYSGGRNGPDTQYDATYAEGDYGFLGFTMSYLDRPIGDVNGDGWRDFMFGDPSYYDPGTDKGIVGILAGGAYIPVDDPSMGVREIASEERQGALSIWPNLVTSELRIAWRGDLRRWPARLEIFDSRGGLVASGSVGETSASATWECAAMPAGVYFLRVRDDAGAHLATASFVKR
jgi:hypothetical protein